VRIFERSFFDLVSSYRQQHQQHPASRFLPAASCHQHPTAASESRFLPAASCPVSRFLSVASCQKLPAAASCQQLPVPSAASFQ